MVQYKKGLSETIRSVCSKHGIQVYFRGGMPSKTSQWAPKDKDPITKKNGVIYRYKCERVEYGENYIGESSRTCEKGEYDEKYIGESSRTFGESFKEYLKPPFPVYEHCNTIGHTTKIVENFSTEGREDQNLMRTIKKAIYIRVNNPSLNKNGGKYHLPHIWDEVLFNTSELKIK